jgi:hypothetical protein
MLIEGVETKSKLKESVSLRPKLQGIILFHVTSVCILEHKHINNRVRKKNIFVIFYSNLDYEFYIHTYIQIFWNDSNKFTFFFTEIF